VHEKETARSCSNTWEAPSQISPFPARTTQKLSARLGAARPPRADEDDPRRYGYLKGLDRTLT